MTFVNALVLLLFLVGGGLVAVMVVITQRAYKKDERSPHWVVYPTAKGERPAIPAQPGTWTLLLDDAGQKKIQVIKEIRGITGLGLAEAKALTDRFPSPVLAGVDHASASAAYRVLANAGARVRMAEIAAEPAPETPAGLYTVYLDDAGDKLIQVIKEIRGLTNLGLAEAKRLSEQTPAAVVTGVPHAAAAKAHQALAGAGARVRTVDSAGHAMDTVPETTVASGLFAVLLDDTGKKKINVIKEIRAVTGLGLADAKRLSEQTPSTVLARVPHATAADALDKLTAAGATARITEAPEPEPR